MRWNWVAAAVPGVRFFGVCILLAASGCSLTGKSRRIDLNRPIAAPGLRIGDTIAIVAPGHPLDRVRVEQAACRLRAMGFGTKIVGDIYVRRGYLAGADAARAEAIMAAYRDPQVKAIFCGTGGYGTTRILERLDFDLIATHPKILLGFSDVTALHLAIAKQVPQITFHGPNLMWGLGSPDRNLTPFASVHLWRLLCTPDALKELTSRSQAQTPHEPIPGFAEAGPGALSVPLRYDLSLCGPDTPRPTVLRPGCGRGRLIGGNLSLVCALMGTRWEIETRGRILFLEDVGEAPYRIDRFLRQLKQGGKLDGVAGVILGRWHKCVADKPEQSLTLDEVFADYFTDAPYPVIVRFPSGHVKDNATLPVGVMAELDADVPAVTILEPPVR